MNDYMINNDVPLCNNKYSNLEYSKLGYILAAMNIKKSLYTEEFQTLIAKLKEARIKQGLTQEQVAKSLGVGQSFISKIESGQYRLDIIQLQAFAKLYTKSISWFLKD